MRLLNHRTRPAALAGLLVLGTVVIYGAFAEHSIAATEKWLIQKRYEDLRGQSARLPKPDAVAARPVATPDEPWPTGIIEEGQAPLPAAAITVKNQWQGVISGQYVQVYAGALPDDPAQGVVIVAVTSPTLEPVSVQRFVTPSKAGAVRIVSEQDQRLTLHSASGVSSVFDLPSRAFLKAGSK